MTAPTLQSRVEALLAAGVSKRLIARACGCDESTIYRIRTGEIKDPRYSIGEGISRLYQGLDREITKDGTDS